MSKLAKARSTTARAKKADSGKSKPGREPVSKANKTNKTLHDHIADRIIKLSDAMIRLSSKSIKRKFGLRHTDFRLMNVLDGDEPLSVNEIGRRALVDQAWVSRSLRELEKSGFVKRKKDSVDTRRSLIYLTSHGRQTLDKLRPYAVVSERMILENVDEKMIKTALDKIDANVENMLTTIENLTDLELPKNTKREKK